MLSGVAGGATAGATTVRGDSTPASRAGAVETDRQILPRADLLHSDYYNGFMKPRDMHAVMRITLAVEPGFRRIFSMTRSVSRGDYEAGDIERCRQLAR
ncbi:MAG: hypothetical protein J0L61_09170, partial [Planctomycetes bacterium]|nr:hypothetical protein [Planctomycetota bacterium]